MPYYRGKEMSELNYLKNKYKNARPKKLEEVLEKAEERIKKRRKTYICKKCGTILKCFPQFHLCGRCWKRFQNIEKYLERYGIISLNARIKKTARVR